MSPAPPTADPIHDRRTLILYFALAFGLTALAAIPILRSGDLHAWGGNAVFLAMWCPGIAGIITALVRFRSLRPLGFDGNRRVVILSLVAVAVPVIYTLAVHLPLEALGVVTLGRQNLNLNFLFVGLVHVLAMTVGEEIGWRGLASPLITRVFGFGRGQALLGVIWFLWHLPFLLFSNYGASPHPFFGNTMFLLVAVTMSLYLGWLRQAGASLWPCALFHAAHNRYYWMLLAPVVGQTELAEYLIGEQGLMLVVASTLLAAWALRAEKRAPTLG